MSYEETTIEVANPLPADLEHLAKNLRDDPSDPATWDELDEVGANHPDEVASLYREALRVADPRVGTALGERALRFHEEWFDEDSKELIDVLHQLLQGGAAALAFERLTVHYTSTEQWSELRDLYERMIQAAPNDARRAELLEELMQLLRDVAGDAERAIDTMMRLVTLRKRDKALVSQLENVLERSERWSDLVVLGRGQLEVARGDEKVALRVRIATMLFERLQQAGEALEELATVLTGTSTHVEDACRLLEKIAADQDTSPETRRRALTLLKERYEVDHRTTDITRILGAAIELVGRDEQLALHKEAAEQLVAADRLSSAMQHWAAYLKLDPESQLARAALASLADRSGERELQLRAYEEAARTAEPAVRVDLLMAAAGLRLQALGNPSGAAALYERVLAEDGVEPNTALQACSWLVDIYARLDQASERLTIFERWAELEPDRRERRRVHEEAARLASELGESERALSNWEACLEIDDTDATAQLAIMRLLERLERWERLVEVLQVRAGQHREPAYRWADARRAAAIQSAKLGDRQAAIDTLLPIYRETGDEGMLDELVAWYGAEGDADALRKLYQDRIAIRAERSMALAEAYAELCITRGEHSAAAAAWSQMLLQEPTSKAARAGLESLLAEGECLEIAVPVLARVYREEGDMSSFVGLLETRLSLAEDDLDRVDLLSEAAAIAAQLEDYDTALDAAGRALQLQPYHAGHLRTVLTLADQSSNYQAAATLLGQAAERSQSAALFEEQGRLYEDKLHNPEAAFTSYASAARLAPDQLGLTGAAVKLAAELEHWEQADQLLEASLAYHPHRVDLLQLLCGAREHGGPRGLIDALLRLSEQDPATLDPLARAVELSCAHDRNRDRVGGLLQQLFDRAERVVTRRAEHRGERDPRAVLEWVTDRLIEYYEATNKTSRLVSLLLDVAPHLSNRSWAYRQRAAELLASTLDEPARAIRVYGELFAENPEDEGVVEALGRLYEKEGRTAELLEIRRHQAERAIEDARRDLRLEMSQLLGQLESSGSRTDLLRHNLEEIPGHPASLDALVSVLSAQSRSAELADVLERQASRLRSREPARASLLLRQVAEIARTELGDVGRAAAALGQLAELDDNLEVIDTLIRLCQQRGDRHGLARWIARRLERTQGAARTSFAMDLARTLDALGNVARAREVLEEAMESDPEDRTLQDTLRANYERSGEWQKLARHLGVCAAAAKGEEALSMLREAAALYHERLGTPEDAVEVLRQAVAFAPADRDLRMWFARSLVAANELPSARAVLEEAIDAFGRRRGPERAALHVELGRICHLDGDLEAALEHLEQATKMDRESAGTLKLLADLAREAGDTERAERVYRTLLVLLRRRGDSGDAEVSLAEVLYELSLLAELRGESDKVSELRQAAVSQAAESDFAALALSRALGERHEYEAAREVLEGRLIDADDRVTIGAELAAVLAGPLAEPERALRVLSDILVLDPSRESLHDQAQAWTRDLGVPERYAELLRSLLDDHQRREDRDVTVGLRLRLARWYEHELDQPELARDLYQEASRDAEAARQGESLRALARLARRRGDVVDERARLRRLLDEQLLDGPDKIDALYRIGELELSETSLRDHGVESLRAAYEQEPRGDMLIPVLRKALLADADHIGVLRLFEQVTQDSGDPRLSLDVLEARAMRITAKVADVRAAIDAAQELGDVERAHRLLEHMVTRAERDSDSDSVRWAAQALATSGETREDVSEAIRWLDVLAAHARDEEETRRIELRLLAACAQPGGDAARVMEIGQRRIEEDPTDRAIYLPVLRALRAAGKERQLLELSIHVAEGLLDPHRRAEVRMEHVDLLMADPDRRLDAIPLLQQVLDDAPDYDEATSRLAELYKESGYDEDLVDLLMRQFDAARDQQDPLAITKHALQLGEVLGKVRRQDAIDVYRQALEWAPTDRDLACGLLDLLGEDADPHDRVEARERVLASETGEAAAELAREVYEEWQTLGNRQGMRRALELGYRAYPQDEEVRKSLEFMYRMDEDWAALAHLLVAEARRLTEISVDDRRQLLMNAVDLFVQQASDAASAIAALRDALELMPEDVEILGRLAELVVASGDFESARDDLSHVLDVLEEDTPARAQLLQRRAQVMQELGDSPAAIADLEEAFRLDASSVAPALIEALESERTRAAESADLRAVWLRLSEVRVVTGDSHGARQVLHEWVQRKPDDHEALIRLRDIDVGAENWEGVVETCRRLVALESGHAQIDTAMLLADACEATESLDIARQVLEDIRRSHPAHDGLRERLRLVYEQSGAHRPLADMLLSEAETEGDEERRFELLGRAARLLIDAVGDVEAALPIVERAAELRPDDHRTTLLRVDAHIGLGQYADAGSLLEDAIAHHNKRRSPELAEYQQRMAELSRVAGDEELELQWLTAALDSDKHNGFVAAELANLAMRRGDHDTALNALRAVTMMKATGPMSRAQAFLMQAQIANERGESRRAILWARKAKSEDPELLEAATFLAQIEPG